MFIFQLILLKITNFQKRDHAHGNNDLVSLLDEKIPIYGGDDRVQGITNIVGQGDIIEFGNIKVHVKFTPCHTKGHVLYFVEQNDDRYIFTGDTLFIGGCGRFFEGTAEQMVAALKQISELPENTKVMCGHEYTVANLNFAISVDPNNSILKSKFEWAKQQRSENKFTIPSTIKEELEFNPFMRVNVPEIQKAVSLEGGDPVEVMAALRQLKNDFKGSL